jgi:hypothetical protein
MKMRSAENLATLLIRSSAMKRAITFMIVLAGIVTGAAVVALFGAPAPAEPSAEISPVWTE